ncbi:hypothetical protein ARMGADRAFT_1035937 [Armillaria gallica]|uniref:Uncharacterized protein n=1 Tax=Armillaria gallica TaxID=47427 RepID=A0A2H3CSD7_ARMGA|nr:hypothetical protein ARMGADRAFT_1035937 [Armillaria gallica]
MAFTLILVSCLDQSRYALTIQDGNCTIQSPQPKREMIGIIPVTRGLYCITAPRAPLPMPSTSIAASAEHLITMREFHNLMGHPSEAVLITMAKSGSMLGIQVDLGTKISLGNEMAKAYGDKVVTDIWGPADTESISSHKYSNTYQDVSSQEEVQLHQDASPFQQLFRSFHELSTTSTILLSFPEIGKSILKAYSLWLTEIHNLEDAGGISDHTPEIILFLTPANISS